MLEFSQNSCVKYYAELEITLQNSAEFALQLLLPGLEFMMDLHCVLYFHLPCQNFSCSSLRDELSSLTDTLIFSL